MANQQRITEKAVREWAAKHTPNLGFSQERGQIGIWRKDIGPAHGFQAIGRTWREVARHLGMIEPEMRE